jgi:hypothetical protein
LQNNPTTLHPAAANQLRLFQGLGFEDPELQYRCVLYLPHLTQIRDPVVGEWASSKAEAKSKAALKACAMLHGLQELTYNLKPKARFSIF